MTGHEDPILFTSTSNRLPDWLSQRAALTPHRLAVIADGKSWTFSELDRMADGVATSLWHLQARPGKKVALLAANGMDFVAAVHGIMRVGAVLVPINARLSPTEITHQLSDARVELVLVDEVNREKAAELQAPIASSRLRAKIVPLESIIPQESHRSHGAHELDNAQSSFRTHIDLDELHSVIYTSGTTGSPKGAMLTYGNHWWSAIGSMLNLGLHKGDAWLACLPLYHVGGMSILMRSVIYGMTAVIHRRFEPDAIIDSIMRGETTIVSAVSYMLQRMIDQMGERSAPSTLRCVLVGGGPVPRSLLEASAAKGLPVVQTYGMTETASQIATLSPEDALRKIGSAGKPLFGAEIRVVEAKGHVAPSNPPVGEIQVRGPSVSPGYLGSKKTLRGKEDWFSTGDLGYFDEEGYLFVVDRRTDLIISGGENVYPAEIEAMLHKHPRVQEAGVVGVSDAKWGQVPVAFVVPKEATDPLDESALNDHCRQVLAPYKVPKHIFFLSKLPRNAAGKLSRLALRKRLEEPIFYELYAPPTAQPLFEGATLNDVPAAHKDLTPLIFLHGDFATGSSWSRQWSELAKTWPSIVADRRGSGKSKPRGDDILDAYPFTIADDAGDVVALMSQVQAPRAHIVGHSYGGLIALEIARRHPERVASLHLIEPPYLSLVREDSDAKTFTGNIEALLKKAPSLTPEEIARAFFLELFGKEAVEHLAERPAWGLIVGEALRFARQQFASTYPAEAIDQVDPDIPTVVYVGGQSPVALQKAAQAVANKLPKAIVKSFPDAGHDVQRLGTPFNEALLEFIQNVQTAEA